MGQSGLTHHHQTHGKTQTVELFNLSKVKGQRSKVKGQSIVFHTNIGQPLDQALSIRLGTEETKSQPSAQESMLEARAELENVDYRIVD